MIYRKKNWKKDGDKLDEQRVYVYKKYWGGGTRMRKKILTYLLLVGVLSGTIILFLIYNVTKTNELDSEVSNMKTTLDQVIQNLSSNDEKLESAKEIFTEDYLNRAKFAEYLIHSDEDGIITENEWKEFLKLLEVSGVSIVDSQGIIVQSSYEPNIGLDFYAYDELEFFCPLIEGKVEEGYLIIFDSKSLLEDRPLVYLGIYQEGGGMIQIEIDPDILERYEQESSIESVIAEIPTEYYRTLFVMDKDSGEIVGISKNNFQRLSIEDRTNTILEIDHNPKVIVCDGQKQIAIAENYENYKVIYMSVIDDVLEQVGQQVGRSLFGIWALITSLAVLLYVLVNHLVLKDISNIRTHIEQIFEGHYDIKFEACRTKELTDLSRKLEKLSKLIFLERRKLTHIASMLGEEIAAYEYYRDIDEFFYSDNFLEMAEISEADAKKRAVEQFEGMEQYLKNMQDEFENGEYLETKSGKIIRVRRTYFQNTLYALLEDVTGSRKEVSAYQQRIAEECERNQRDELTGLYNRRKLQEEIELILAQKEPKGIILMLDLDNFKYVNDKKGHLEGDHLLQRFAEIMTEHFRCSDTLARIGGDEFVVFIPNDLSYSVLEAKLILLLYKIRMNLREYYEEMKLSVSIGGVYITEQYTSYNDVYQAADHAMYIAKKSGKDRFYIQRKDDQ